MIPVNQAAKVQPLVPRNIKSYTKPDLIKYVHELEDIVCAYRKEYYAKGEKWFGVAWIGWGSWEEDVYFCEAITPKEAIQKFLAAHKDDTFIGHGYDNEYDRKVFGFGSESTILVYVINEIGWYREVPTKTEWEKV